MNFEMVDITEIPAKPRMKFAPLKNALLANRGKAVKLAKEDLAALKVSRHNIHGCLGYDWLPADARLRTRSVAGDIFLWLERTVPPDNNGGA